MSIFSVLGRRSFVLLMAAVTALAVPATAAAVPTASGGATGVLTGQHAVAQVSAATKSAKTRVVVKVRNCATCQVTLISAPRPPAEGEDPSFWSRQSRVKKGKVSYRVPAARTEGLYLTVWDRKAVSTGAMPIAVAQYKGQRVGKVVSPRKAARTKQGFHCVATPTTKKVVWKMRVDRFPGRDAYTGRRGYQIRPYFSPTQESFGDSMRLYQGVASAQDIAFCQRTPSD